MYVYKSSTTWHTTWICILITRTKRHPGQTHLVVSNLSAATWLSDHIEPVDIALICMLIADVLIAVLSDDKKPVGRAEGFHLDSNMLANSLGLKVVFEWGPAADCH